MSDKNTDTDLGTGTKEIEALYVQSAKGMAYADGTLTLQGIAPSTIIFSDRPDRLAVDPGRNQGQVFTVQEKVAIRCGRVRNKADARSDAGGRRGQIKGQVHFLNVKAEGPVIFQ